MKDNTLNRHHEIWKNKKILKIIYENWYEKILSELSEINGKNLEIGSGTGNFKEYYPDITSSDVYDYEWIDYVFDAHQIPFKKNTIANIVLIDALHHLANPVMFLNEAYRILKKNGKIIMLEPFPSPFSLFIYKRFHPEPFYFDIDYFSYNSVEEKHPWDSNQAIPYLLFYKYPEQFHNYFKNQLKIEKKEKLSFLLYPLSGGFENKQLIPDLLIPVFQKIEKLLYPLRDFMAFRCYVVLKKID